MCFVPAVKSSAVVLTILCFFVFTKREQVFTVLLVYINSFCYSVIFEAFIQFTPKFIVAFLDKKSTLLYLLINSLKIDNSEC